MLELGSGLSCIPLPCPSSQGSGFHLWAENPLVVGAALISPLILLAFAVWKTRNHFSEGAKGSSGRMRLKSSRKRQDVSRFGGWRLPRAGCCSEEQHIDRELIQSRSWHSIAVALPGGCCPPKSLMCHQLKQVMEQLERA